MSANKPTVLLLEDGRVFSGQSFGYIGQTIGEVCFNTGMSGYQEILTDPSYCKQIVTMTSPHIGNYGINPEDIESENIQVAGFAIKEETLIPSNWRSVQSIGNYLKKEKIVGIKSIDTRALTRHIRNQGSMNGIISSTSVNVDSLKRKLSKSPSMEPIVKQYTGLPSPYTRNFIHELDRGEPYFIAVKFNRSTPNLLATS